MLPVCTCLPSTTASFHTRNRKPRSLPLTYQEHRTRELLQGGRRRYGSLCYKKLSTWVSCRRMLQLGNKRAGLRKNNKISRTCTNKSLFFAYAACVGRASYGRLEAIFILYPSECDREMSIWNECELSEEEERMKKTRLLPLIKRKPLPLSFFCQSTSQLQGQRPSGKKALAPTQAPQRVVNNSTCLPLRPNTELQRINYVYLESLRKFKTKFHFLHNMTPLVSVSHTNVKQGDYRLFYGTLVRNYFIVYAHTTYSLSCLLYRFFNRSDISEHFDYTLLATVLHRR